MKEFNIEFLKKSKFNLTLSFLALCLLFISIITMTYCWIEGSASIEIKNAEGNPITVSDTNKSLYILSDTSSTTTINLASYIDNNTSLFLAPAKSVDGKTIQIKNGDSFRNATVNDINNNYIEFDVKFNAPTETKFTFTNDSEITIDGAPTRSIKMSLEVDDIVQKTMSGDALSDQEAFVSLGQHVLTVRIWLDCETAGYENLYGKTVDFNFTLATQKNVTNLTFIDRTASQTAQYLTSGKTMKVVYRANGQTVTTNMTTETNNTFSVSEIPISALPTVEFQCFNGTTMVAKWSGTAARVNGSFTAYGSIFSTTDYGYGTWEDVVKVNFKDNSIDSTFNPTGNYVTITNNIDPLRYNMFYNSTNKTWSAYVPKESFTVSGNVSRKIYINSRNSTETSINYTEADVSGFNDLINLNETTYSVYGDSGIKGVEFNDSLYYGTWCDSADSLTIIDRTENRTITSAENEYKVSFDGTNYYYAKYNSLYKTWSVNVPSDTVTPLNFSAVANAVTYLYNGENRTQNSEGNFVYAMTSSIADTSGYCTGTWNYVETGTTLKFVDNTNNTDYDVSLYLYDGSTAYKMTQDSVNRNTWSVIVPDSVKTDIKFYRCSKSYELDINNKINGSAATADGYYNMWSAGSRYLNTQYSATTIASTDSGCNGLWNDLWKLFGGTMDLEFEATETDGVYTAEFTSNAQQAATFKVLNFTATDYYGNASTIANSTSSPLIFTKEVTNLCTLNISGQGIYTFTLNITGENPTLEVAGVSSRVIYLRNTSNWSSQFAYWWKLNGTVPEAWPGTKMTLHSGNIFRIEIPNNYDMIIFNSGSGGAQTSDLTIPTDGNNMYDNSTGTWSLFDPDSVIYSDYYLKGTFNSWGTTDRMSYQIGSSTIAETSVELTAGRVYDFKININDTWYTNSNSYTGTDSTTNINFNTTGGSNNNCKFTPSTTGTYKFSFNINNKTLTIIKQS